MVELTLPIVLQIVQTVGILVGIIYYLTIMRNSQRNQELTLKAQEQTLETRQAQLFLNTYNVYTSKQFQKDREELMQLWKWTDYDDFYSKYGSDVDAEAKAIFDSILLWLEGLGTLVKRGLIDPELVHDLLYAFIINFWERHLPIISRLREQHGPKVLEDLESLYDHMNRLSEKHGKDGRAALTSRTQESQYQVD